MHANARGLSRCRNGAYALEESAAAAAARRAAWHEGQLRFHLRVLRKVLRHRHVDRAAAVLEPIAAHLAAEVVGVTQEKVGHVDEDASAAVTLRRDVES